MDPTSLDRLLKEEGVTLKPDGLTVTVQPSWIIEGEDRLSYTTLIRLVECCREHHWNIDILARAEDTSVDSITKSIAGEFVQSIPVGSEISITYEVNNVRRKGYTLKFKVRDAKGETLYAILDVVSISYNPKEKKVVPFPEAVFDHLSNMCNSQRMSSVFNSEIGTWMQASGRYLHDGDIIPEP